MAHGEPAADGGHIFLRETETLNGKELAQILTQGGIRLAVFNSCWGAQTVTAKSSGDRRQ